MKCESSSSSSILAVAGRTGVLRSFGIVVGVGLAAVALGACGGDDDSDASSTTTIPVATTEPAVTATTAAPATTAPPTTVACDVEYVTEGATVIVANSSGINGAAGRMSERLAAVGYTMGTATNGSEGQLEVSKIYYDPANESALPVAESLREALGGGDIQLLEMGVPAPVESGDIGDASIVLLMGNDVADKELDELQGCAAPPAEESTTEESTTEESTTEESTTEESTTEESTTETTTDTTTETTTG